MKRGLAIFAFILLLVAWWATGRQQGEAMLPPGTGTPAAYPADFGERLRRIAELKLEQNTPLPEHLPWNNAQGHPPVGNPDAKRGGCMRMSNAGPYPAHFLRFGGGTAQFFHQNLAAATEIPLVARHPLTGQTTAGVAQEWCTVGNTHYFRLNPEARYNNGSPVRAADYLLAALLQEEVQSTEAEALREVAVALRAHGAHVLSIELCAPLPIEEAAALLFPAEPGFYADFNSRYRETYARRIPPTTGPYRVSKVQRGRMIELQRVAEWWGEPLPLARHRFNADTLEYHFLTSEAQVWELFLRGELDALQTRNTTAWQERLADRPELPTLVYDAEYPLPPYGIALNTRTLPDAELRRGLLYAMDMDKAVELMMRGEGRRLTTFHSGYGEASPKNTPQYRYNPAAARACFTREGYTTADNDGILRRSDGTRLSVTLLYSPNEKISNLLATLIRSAAACGAEIVPEPVPWQVCRRRLLERSHQLVFWAVPAPQRPAPELFFAPGASPDYSPFSLDSAEMNEALKQGELARIDRLVYELAVWLPGWKENRVYLVHHPHLRVPPSPWCFDALDAHLFWLKPEP